MLILATALALAVILFGAIHREESWPRIGFKLLYVAISIALASCAGLLPTPATSSTDDHAPERFHRVDGNLYRSAQPTLLEMVYLRDHYNIHTVIKLNPTIEAREPHVDGVEVIYLPLSVVIEPSKSDMDAAMAWIDVGLRSGGVLVHCSHGEDRTGLVVGVYELRHGVDWPSVLAGMVNHGWHPYAALWKRFAAEAGW